MRYEIGKDETDDDLFCVFGDDSGIDICQTWTREQAESIARALNAFEPMRKVLGVCATALDEVISRDCGDQDTQEALIEAKEVLASGFLGET